MFDQDFSTLLLVCGWSLAAVGVGLVCGFFIGKFYNQQHESKKLKQERENTLTALLQLMQSTNQLNDDVDEHHSSLSQAQHEIEALSQSVSDKKLHLELMSNITRVVSANRRLENDLVVSRYKLESQAQELDKTRLEARTDPLCEIGNRKAIDERLKFMVSRFHNEQISFGLMLIDVDHFKRINDTFGHAAGDEVLSSIALAMRECVRPGDFVGRLGGDEFVVMFDGLTTEYADSVGKRVRSAIETYDFSLNDKGQTTVVTLSMGLAIVGNRDTTKSLYERADQALYRSKELGRNRLYTLLEEPVSQPTNFTQSEVLLPASKTSRFGKNTPSAYEAFKASLTAEV